MRPLLLDIRSLHDSSRAEKAPVADPHWVVEAELRKSTPLSGARIAHQHATAAAVMLVAALLRARPRSRMPAELGAAALAHIGFGEPDPGRRFRLSATHVKHLADPVKVSLR